MFLLLFSFLFSCHLFTPESEDQSPQDDYTALQYNTLFSVDDYRGFTAVVDGASEIIDRFDRITFQEPQMNYIQADGYFDFRGSLSTDSDETPLMLLNLIKGEEQTSYWLQGGEFDERIWLRFGEGVYTVEVLNIIGVTQSTHGVISSWTYQLPAAFTFQVENTNQEDGRFLYPSAVVQSDHAALLSLASGFDSEDMMVQIRDIHDWVVCYLQYDKESNDNPLLRKKQDGLSSYLNEMAVCEGYAALYLSILRARRIPGQYITGTANGGNHAWTRVYNGSIWNYVDPTWDDPIVGDYLTGHSNYPQGENLRDDYFWESGWPSHMVDPVDGARVDRGLEVLDMGWEIPGYPKGSY